MENIKPIIGEGNKENPADQQNLNENNEIEIAHDEYSKFLKYHTDSELALLYEKNEIPYPVKKIDGKTSFFGIDKYKNVIYYNEKSKTLKLGNVREYD